MSSNINYPACEDDPEDALFRQQEQDHYHKCPREVADCARCSTYLNMTYTGTADPRVATPQPPSALMSRRYYYDVTNEVVMSIDDPSQMQPGVNYYRTPDEAQKDGVAAAVRLALEAGLLTREQLLDMLGVGETSDAEVRPTPGPRGRRKRKIPVKPPVQPS